jgi:hypothetical protein
MTVFKLKSYFFGSNRPNLFGGIFFGATLVQHSPEKRYNLTLVVILCLPNACFLSIYDWDTKFFEVSFGQRPFSSFIPLERVGVPVSINRW